MLTDHKDIIEPFGVADTVDYIKNLTPPERRRQLLTLVATLMYHCLEEREIDHALKLLVKKVKETQKDGNWHNKHYL